MRIFAIFAALFGLALGVFLVAHRSSTFRAPAKVGQEDVSRLEQGTFAPELGAPPSLVKTNPTVGLPEGFYIGKGNQRAYVNYATPDPVLRSLLQSVMDGSSDPNSKGKEIFLRICAACHQRDGEGKDGVAPPLAGSEWVSAPGGGRLVRIVLNGLTGPVRVNGKDWNLPMPPWRANLDDVQVAVVLTYIRSQLANHHAAPITPERVAEARKEVRTTPETAADLLRIPEP